MPTPQSAPSGGVRWCHRRRGKGGSEAVDRLERKGARDEKTDLQAWGRGTRGDAGDGAGVVGRLPAGFARRCVDRVGRGGAGLERGHRHLRESTCREHGREDRGQEMSLTEGLRGMEA